MSSSSTRKGMALSQVILLLATGFFFLVLPTLPANVSGDSGTYYVDSARDGYLSVTSYSGYPPVDTPDVYDTEDWIATACSLLTKPSIHYSIERAFVSFDTSAIPDNATIQSVSLRLKLQSISEYDYFEVQVRSSSYGTLDAGDWSDFASLQGVLFNSLSAVEDSWYSVACSGTSIDKQGYSEFCIKLDIDNETLPSGFNYIQFFSGESAYDPTLSVVWTDGGIAYSIQLTSDGYPSCGYLNSSMYPDVEDWNLTYNRWNFEFATVPYADNVTIFKSSSSWEFLGMAPLCNYTQWNESFNMTDVYDSITYRVWFAVPKASAWTTLYIRLYDAFTGEGFFWEQWNVMICEGSPWNNTTAETVPTSEYRVEPNAVYTLRVLDYFGNPVVNQTVTSYAEEVFVSISIPVYSYKFYNQNPSFTLLRIYYNLTGTPYSEFIPPYDYVNRYLKAGTYQFMITLYDEEGIVGDSYTWTRTLPSETFPGAGYVILEGDTITEAIIAANGAKALVEVVADLVAPEMLWIGYTVPQIPSYLLTISSFVVQNNYYMVNGNVLNSSSGTSLSFVKPTPDNCISPTIIRDDFTFSGYPATHIIINNTDAGTTVYNSLTLPATLELDGAAYSIWSNLTVSVSRNCDWRWYRAFTWQYLAGEDQYIGEISVRNSLAINWRNVTLFIPFANASYVNNRSVQIYDMNNTVYLEEGTHFVQSGTGVYLWFNVWNASVTRAFRLTYTSVNESQFDTPPSVTVNALGNGVSTTTDWNGMTYYFAIARWTNAYREAYEGPFYILLSLPVSVDASTVIILTASDALVLDAVISGNTIMIPKVSVDVGELIQYTVLFNSNPVDSLLDIKAANLPIVLLAAFVAVITAVVGVYGYIMGKEGSRLRIAGKTSLGVAVLALMLDMLIFLYYIGVS